MEPKYWSDPRKRELLNKTVEDNYQSLMSRYSSLIWPVEELPRAAGFRANPSILFHTRPSGHRDACATYFGLEVQIWQKVARECISSFIRQQVARRRSGLWARLVNKFSSDKKMLADGGLFDADWYLQNYPDVAEACAAPLDHYLKLGASEGRDPNPFFSTKAYMKFNLDVARSGVNSSGAFCPLRSR